MSEEKHPLTERLTELESRLAFQEDTLDQLNAIVTEQAHTIEHLKRQNEAINERLHELGEVIGPEIENTPPPHY